MVSFTVVSALSFAALATAIPHSHQRFHERNLARNDQSANYLPLAGRAVSFDGSCGLWSGATCPAGTCCGPNGWCGSGDVFCGTGCQVGFGLCGSGAAAPVAPASTSSSVAAPATTAAPTSAASVAEASSVETSSITATLGNKGADHGPGFRSSHWTTFATRTMTSSAIPSPSESSSAPAYSTPTTAPVTTTAPTTTSAYSSAPTATSSAGSSSGSGSTYIKTYKGDGSISAGWPDQSAWFSFETLWNINLPIMSASCENAFSVPNNSDQELTELKSAVSSIAASNGVDTAFVFAIMMQESNGCVRAPTTVYSISNPGLFQSHEGSGSCNNAADGGLQNPCPSSEISQMITDGVAGTSSGDGLKQLVTKNAGMGAQTYYEAARMYNSGSIDPSGNLGLGVATHCYVSDIANRLTGWNQGPTACDANTVGS